MTPAGRSRFPALAVLDTVLLAAGVVVLLILPRVTGGDGRVRYDAARALVSGDVPHERYSLVTPLLVVPFDVLGRLVGAEEAVAYRFNGIVFALGLVAFWLLLRRDVPATLIRPFLLLLVFGSMFSGHVTSLYGETTTAVFLSVGLLAVVSGQTGTVRVLGWSAAVLAAVDTPAIIPAFCLAVLVIAVARRAAWPLLAIVVAIGLSLADIRLQTGSLSSPYAGDHGYRTILPFSGRAGFSYPALFGILSILFSFGKGLVFFAPGLFVRSRGALASYTGLDRTRVVWIVIVAGMVAVYCRWWAWYGGEFYGPRFFLFASVPASLAIAARLSLRERSLGAVALTLGVLGLSVWVAIVGALGSGIAGLCVQDRYSLEFLCWYTPEFSQLWQPLLSRPHPSTSSLVFAGLAIVTFVRLAVTLLIDAKPIALERAKALRSAYASGRHW